MVTQWAANLVAETAELKAESMGGKRAELTAEKKGTQTAGWWAAQRAGLMADRTDDRKADRSVE
jgi:hypothetical protein